MVKSKIYYHVFDIKTIENINKLKNNGYIGELNGPLGSGKESYVFYSENHIGKPVAVKIHRHTIDTFKSIPTYLKLRGKDSKGFIRRIDDWTRYEFEFLSKAYSIGIKCPAPHRREGNVIVMDFIGKDGIPADLLINKETVEERWYKKTIDSIILMAKNRIIHGDLSPYNIMVMDDELYFIDFSQARAFSNNTISYLIRDIRNINDWFAKRGIKDIIDENEIMNRV